MPPTPDIPSVPSLHLFARRNVLLLQGPPGPFFRRLAKDLRNVGARVRKINFNGGDWLHYPAADLTFCGSLEDWPSVLRSCLERWEIDTVFLYNDTRPVHQALFDIATGMPLRILTFEEGYLRPDFITLENGRANGHSTLLAPTLREAIPCLRLPSCSSYTVGYSFPYLAWHGFWYHAAASLLSPLMPGQHTYHRQLGIAELPAQIRSYWRKVVYHRQGKRLQDRLCGELSGRFFLVPLQVAVDSQIHHHSRYARGGIKAFIEDVAASFAAHAPADAHLVFKHHPMDRGYTSYFALMDRLRASFPVLRERLHYVFDLDLPSALEHAAGVVVINSTVGLSAIIHGAPVKVFGGVAIYDFDGLTAQIPLDSFWKKAEDCKPDSELTERFRSLLLHCCQINGNFYRRLPQSPLHCGVMWNVDSH